MKNYDQVPTREFVYATLFVASNRLDTLMHRKLTAFGITTKQWFLSIVVENAFEGPPTIKQVASQMGCSHQNAKQVALKLEEKGLLTMFKDESDHRVTRMKPTQKSDELWEDISPVGSIFMDDVFNGLTENEMETMRSALIKITENIEKMDNK